jgi:hypothetical protein
MIVPTYQTHSVLLKWPFLCKILGHAWSAIGRLPGHCFKIGLIEGFVWPYQVYKCPRCNKVWEYRGPYPEGAERFAVKQM